MLIIIIPSESWSQFSSTPSIFTQDINEINGSLYYLGLKFKENGNDNYSILYKYDNNLKLDWTYIFDSSANSQFTNIEVVNDLIFVTGVHGISNHSLSDLYQYLYILSTQGKLIEKVKIGHSRVSSTNILVNKNTVFLSYAEADAKHFKDIKRFTSTVAKYNLTTKKLTKYYGCYSKAFPYKILLMDDVIIVSGDYDISYNDLIQEQFLLSIKDEEIGEEIIGSEAHETFLNAVSHKNELLVFSYASSNNEAIEYLKINRINKKGRIKNTHILPWKDFRWKRISRDNYATDSSIWINIEKDDSTDMHYFLEVDFNGNIRKEIAYKKYSGFSKFIILPDRQIHTQGTGINDPPIEVRYNSSIPYKKN